ncbi:MAG: MarR family transcriptional regulator [Proteobacteria bacterium]|nr:MarR family transcriptional regulator [Pseudomonadota bacterium]
MGNDDLLILKLVRVVNLTARPFEQRVGKPLQLSLNEWRVMAMVARQPGCNASQVAEYSGMDKMAVSRALAGLQRAKRLQRHEDPTDQRRSRLYLSAAGRAVYDVALARAQEREAQLLTDMTAREREHLGTMLDKLIASVRKSDG